MKDSLYYIKPFSTLVAWCWHIVIATLTMSAIIAILHILLSIYIFHSPIRAFTFTITLTIAGSISGMIIGRLQQSLFRKRFYWEAQSWVKWSGLGGLLAGFITGGMLDVTQYLGGFDLVDYFSDEYIALKLSIILAVGILSAVQMVPLRHVVKQAWFWVLAYVGAAIVSVSLIFSLRFPQAFLAFVLSLLCWGLIPGATLLYLFKTQAKDFAIPDEMQAFVEDERKPHSVWDNAI